MEKPREIWRQIKIHELRGRYMVSENGKIKTNGRYAQSTGKRIPSKQLSPCLHPKGYLHLGLSRDGYRKSFFVHRLVAMFFVQNPYGKSAVNHKDGNKLNNHYSNLEWCTVEENNTHALVNNLNNGNSKVTYQQRKDIRARFHSTPREQLMKEYNLTNDEIYGIGTGGRRGAFKGVGKNGIRKLKIYSPPVYKPIIDLNTGIFYNTDELAGILGIQRRYVHRLLSEERKPNTTQYRYA